MLIRQDNCRSTTRTTQRTHDLELGTIIFCPIDLETLSAFTDHKSLKYILGQKEYEKPKIVRVFRLNLQVDLIKQTKGAKILDDEWNMEIPKIRSRYLSKKAYEKGFSKDTCKSKYTRHPGIDKIYHDIQESILVDRNIKGHSKL